MPRPIRYGIHPENPQPRTLLQAAALLRAGGVAVLPVAAGYVLACRLGDKAAARRLYQLCGIVGREPATLLCRNLVQAARYFLIDDQAFRTIRSGKAGTAAYLLPASRLVPRRLALAPRGATLLTFAGHTASQALLELLDEALLLALPRQGAVPTTLDQLPPARLAQIDFAMDAGPLGLSVQSPALIDLQGLRQAA